MPNDNDEWVFAPKCAACDRTAASIRLVYGAPAMKQPDGVLLIEDTPGGSNGDGWEITAARAERIKAAFAPPHDDFARIRQAGFADDAGFCSECLDFYCWSHWNVLSSGVGWCAKHHTKTIDPYCAHEA